MKENETETSTALEQIHPQRRDFLTKMLAGGVAIPVMSSMAQGAPQAGKGKGGKGKGGKGKGEGGKGKGQMPGGESGGIGRDPSELAKRLVAEFDKDGDKALSVRELTAALTAMRERRGSMEGGDPSGMQGKGKGGAGKGKGAEGKGKGKGRAGSESIGAGGVAPKRPE